jgi:RHS repeat-associated protein
MSQLVVTKGSTTTSTTYKYNDEGSRILQTERVDNGAITTTLFHVDPHNHTGYAQVLEEGGDDNANGNLASAEVDKSYALGHDVLFEATTAAPSSARFFVYDGHGSTRMLLASPTPTTVTVQQRYAYDAYGNQLTGAGSGLTTADAATTRFLYSGERTDKTGLQYLRARYYDPRSGRFTQLDPFAGNVQDPLSLHKYLYVHGDPVNMIDPSGLFSIASTLSVGGIQNTIATGIGYLNTAFRIYNTVQRIVSIYDYATTILRFARALQAPTPAGAAAALASELRDQFGSLNHNAIIQAFDEMARQVGASWKEIAHRIGVRAPDIAREAFQAVLPNLGRYAAAEASGDLQFLFYLPTGPGRRTGDTPISITDRFGIMVSPSGGRLFGFGVRTAAQRRGGGANADQWFRIDWFDGRVNPPLNVHYHVFGETDRHPGPHRVIWTP